MARAAAAAPVTIDTLFAPAALVPRPSFFGEPPAAVRGRGAVPRTRSPDPPRSFARRKFNRQIFDLDVQDEHVEMLCHVVSWTSTP